MAFDVAVFLAALGITTLELVEASAVGLALEAESKSPKAFLYVAAGVLVVLIPTFILGDLITLLPDFAIKFVGGCLLLYFGLRLVRSARKSVLRARKGGFSPERFEKGLAITAFSVGAVEAFEAAIVLVALLPNGYSSTVLGLFSGVGVVVVSTYVLRNQVRKVKQANMKVVVSALLLSFSVFWFGEVLTELNDLLLVPLFAGFALLVHWIANRPSPGSSPQTASSG